MSVKNTTVSSENYRVPGFIFHPFRGLSNAM